MGKSSKNKPWNSLQGFAKRFNYDYYYDVFFSLLSIPIVIYSSNPFIRLLFNHSQSLPSMHSSFFSFTHPIKLEFSFSSYFYSLNTLRTELRSQRTILENISINMGARSPASNRTNLMDDF